MKGVDIMEFNNDELQIIYNILIQAPYNIVKPLCDKIENNFMNQTKKDGK